MKARSLHSCSNAVNRFSGVLKVIPASFITEDGFPPSDGMDYDGDPLWHPFRLYAVHEILKQLDLHVARSSSLDKQGTLRLLKMMLDQLPSNEELANLSNIWNETVDLAILLEPLFWPRITGRSARSGGTSEEDYEQLRIAYSLRATRLVQTLDPQVWRNIHEGLRIQAARLDENPHLYALLRIASWEQRESVRGSVSSALWIRHMAEVIRRGFEEVHSERWPEEDEAFGQWFVIGRISAYGSARPFDNVLQSKPYLAHKFGLFTGSVVRWYVEGQTEYFAIRHILPQPSVVGIEMMNLKGNIASDQRNAALSLEDCLKEDKALRRFSLISVDADVPANLKALRHQIELDNIVGVITAHKPDFELANFTVKELAEIAACIDESHGLSGDPVRNADWSCIESGRGFEKRYRTVSLRKQRLKGEAWGRALAAYAEEHRVRPGDEQERLLWQQISNALRARIFNYDFQKANFTFDPTTFEIVPRPKPAKTQEQMQEEHETRVV